MKTLKFSLILFLFAAFTACSVETTDTTTSGSDNETAAPAGPAALSFSDLMTEVTADADAMVGQEVTVKAYSWGVSGRMDGLQQVDLGSEKLEGFKQSTLSCLFAEGVDLSAAEKDKEVTIKGTVSEASGMFGGSAKLENCTIVE